jgi:hypothetical protein
VPASRSEQARTWQRGARGERRTARRLDRLARDGNVVFHDLAVPGSPANVDHFVIGPTGLFVIDSKQWTGGVHQSADGLVWHNHSPLDRTLDTARWEATASAGRSALARPRCCCVHGANVQDGGLDAQGVAIAPARLLRSALGYDRVVSDADMELLATTAWTRLGPAACRAPLSASGRRRTGLSGARMAVFDRYRLRLLGAVGGWFGWWRLAPGGQHGRADLLGCGALGDKGARSGLAGDDAHPGALSGGEHHHLDLG